jgi:putative SOS response-associated peptidase YedK
MCGRYQRRSDKQHIAEAFALGNVDGLALELAPDYNVAPTTMQPVIVWDEEFGTRTLHMMFWRFLPPYVTDPKKFRFDTINAKGETMLTSKIWRESFLERRCLIPADSFIEWRRVDAKTRLPWMFGMKDGSMLALGGVWRVWWSPERKPIENFAIVTTEPNELVAEKTGHDRMPLIMDRANWKRWIEPGDPQRPPIELVRPFDSDLMKAWRVDKRINNVKNNDAALSDPWTEQDDGQKGLFE